MATVANPGGARPHASIVVNPNKVDLDAFRAAVRAAEARHGWAPARWFHTRKRHSAIADDVLASKPDLVIVAGGDGTVRRAIGMLLGSEVPLGIVPSGTGNLLARELGLPLTNVDEALNIAFGSTERRLDVLEIDVDGPAVLRRQHVSVVMSGVGIDAAMIANTPAHMKRRFGWVAYVDGVRRSLNQVQPFHVRVSIDGSPVRSHRAVAVCVANLADLPGHVSLAPGAAIDDGELDVIVLQPQRLIDWLLIWRRVSWENGMLRKSPIGAQIAEAFQGRNRNQVVVRRGRKARIEILGGSQPFQVDGDEAGLASTISVTVNPRGVRVRVTPRPHPGDGPHPAKASRRAR